MKNKLISKRVRRFLNRSVRKIVSQPQRRKPQPTAREILERAMNEGSVEEDERTLEQLESLQRVSI